MEVIASDAPDSCFVTFLAVSSSVECTPTLLAFCLESVGDIAAF